MKLPTPVDAPRANASFHNGVLTVSLPEAGETTHGRVRLAAGAPVQGHAGHRE